MAPAPTIRGAVNTTTHATSFALTPSSSPTGEVMLIVGFADGATITAEPAITGGTAGSTWTLLVPRGNEGVNGGGASRLFWCFWGHGVTDQTAITITPADGDTDECRANLVDWANTKTSKPFINLQWGPLANGNTHDPGVTIFQQRRAGTNNVIGGWLMSGVNNLTQTLDEGTILATTTSASGILTVSPFWHNTDLTNFQTIGRWGTDSSSGYFLFEVQATDSDDGANANIRSAFGATADASGDIVYGTFTPKTDEVIVVSAVSERVGDSADWASVSDGTNSYTKISAINLDADHRLHVWANRYGASPGAVTVTASTAGHSQTGSVGTMVGLLKQDGTGLAGTTDIDWFVGAVVTATGTSTTPAATLPTLQTHSAVLAFMANDASAADFTQEQGFIVPMRPRDNALVGIGGATSTSSFTCVWQANDVDPTVSATCTSGDWAVIAIEVA